MKETLPNTQQEHFVGPNTFGPTKEVKVYCFKMWKSVEMLKVVSNKSCKLFAHGLSFDQLKMPKRGKCPSHIEHFIVFSPD